MLHNVVGILVGMLITYIGYFNVRDFFDDIKDGVNRKEDNPKLFVTITLEIVTSFSSLGYILLIVGGIVLILYSIFLILF